MLKNRTLERLLRLLITLVGVGVGAGIAALLLPLLSRLYPEPFARMYGVIGIYILLCAGFGLILFIFSRSIITKVMQLSAAVERRWSSMPTQQIVLSSIGLIAGLAVAALVNQHSLLEVGLRPLQQCLRLGESRLRLELRDLRLGDTGALRAVLEGGEHRACRDDLAEQHPGADLRRL